MKEDKADIDIEIQDTLEFLDPKRLSIDVFQLQHNDHGDYKDTYSDHHDATYS